MQTENKPSILAGPTLPPDAPSFAHPDHDHQNNHDNSINPNHPGGGIGRPPTTGEQNETENGIHPLYPTADGRPPKNGVQPLSKPQKKPTKSDNKFVGPFAPSGGGDRPPPKFEFNNYDDEDEEGLGPQHRPNAQNSNGPGPGFFNPSATKNQYPDYDQAIFHNGQVPQRPAPGQKPGGFNPFAVQGGNAVLGNGNGAEPQDKLPPELLSILGGNAQNIPPHLRIEHLLQQIQGNGNTAENEGQQHPFGISSQGGFPFTPQLNQPQLPNQRPPVGPGNLFFFASF